MFYLNLRGRELPEKELLSVEELQYCCSIELCKHCPCIIQYTGVIIYMLWQYSTARVFVFQPTHTREGSSCDCDASSNENENYVFKNGIAGSPMLKQLGLSHVHLTFSSPARLPG